MIVSISAPPSFRPFINILRSGLEIKFGEGWMKINLQTSLSHTSYLAWTPPFKSSCLALPIRALVPSLLGSEKGRGKVSKQRRLSGGEGPGFLGIYMSIQRLCWQQYNSGFVFPLTFKQIQSKKATCGVCFSPSRLSNSQFGIWQKGKVVEYISPVAFFFFSGKSKKI